jgi:dienelactone hydrolase
MSRIACLAVLFAIVCGSGCARGERVADATRLDSGSDHMSDKLLPESWLVLGPVDDRGRRPFRPDAVLRDHLLVPGSKPPVEGDTLTGERGGAQTWERREVDERGGPTGGGRIGWATTTLESPDKGVMIARLSGALSLWVNGRPVVGDYYGYGYGGVPVQLEQGENRLWVHGIRGSMRLELSAPEGKLVRAPWGDVIPDLITGAGDAGPLGILVMNATAGRMRDVIVTLAGDELFEPSETTLSHGLTPLAVEKLVLHQRLRNGVSIPGGVTSWLRRLTVHSDSQAEPIIEATLELPIKSPVSARHVTFVSSIDGSVQFYGLLPPSTAVPAEPAPARAAVGPGADAGLVLTLHGAGVNAFGQVVTYKAKPDFWIVAPTNRSPFGFDWQDWGRQDTYEVLDHALARTGVHRSRVYVTGHSMGGHGTWHLAANDPDGFAALAPSAGWESFDSYGGRPQGTLRDLWHGADGASSTLALIDNLVQVPAFILHGDADDNVPIDQAHTMLAALEEAGAAPEHHFQPGAGHWWDGSASAGTDCTDWPGIFDLFRRSSIEQTPRELAFTSVDPGVDSTHHWVSFLQPEEYGTAASIQASQDADGVTLVTENVRSLALLEIDSVPVRHVVIDGEALDLGNGSGSKILIRDGAHWLHGQLGSTEKRPSHSGPFKRAFDDDFVLVVGTHGDPAMTAALAARAHHLVGEWWYRANGQATVIDDDDYLLDPPSGNPILLGNADCNSAWSVLLPAPGEPISWANAPWADDWRAQLPVGGALTVSAGELRLGDRHWAGDDLGAVFVRPRPLGLVGAFGFSGVRAVQASYALSPFVSGVGLPDYAVYDSDVLTLGDGGVLAAGWFDHAWQLSE